MKRKILVILPVCLALMSTDTIMASGFNDISSNFAASEIKEWEGYGVLNGYDDSFRPNATITRAELATIVNNIMEYEVSAENNFTDIDVDDWYYDAIIKNNINGNMSGYEGLARPNDNITREETVVVLCKALNISANSGETTFADNSDISSWAKGYVNALLEKGLISGRENNKFVPKGNITRAEVVKLIDNTINGFYHTSGIYSEDIDGLLVINEADVVLADMSVDGDILISAGVGDGDVVLDGVDLSGTLIVEGGGENSIKLLGTTNVKDVVVDKVTEDGVRVFVDENAIANNIDVSGNSSTIIDGTGEIGNVSLNSDKKVEIAESTKIDNLIVSNNCPISINGVVNQLTIDYADVTISGDGKIMNAKVNASNVALDVATENVSLASDIKSVTANGKEISSSTTDNITSSSSGSGSSSSGGGSSTSDKTAPVVTNFKTKSVSNDGATISFVSNETGTYSYKINNVDGVSQTLVEDTTVYALNAGENTLTLDGLVENTDYLVTLSVKDTKSNAKDYTLNFNTKEISAEIEDNDLVDENNTKIVNLGFMQQVVVSFTEGNSLENCSVMVDGVDVSEVMTNVSDDGSIVKWEVTSLNPASVTIKKGSVTESVQLSNNTEPITPVVKNNTSPDYFLTFGIIPVYDYHLTNYDVNGNVRTTAEKTTFSADIDATTSATISYSAQADVITDSSAFYGVTGEVEILFNYSTDEQKAWFDGVGDVDALTLVTFDENKRELNNSLEYTKTFVDHHGSTVGAIHIPIGQSNFYSNGRYYVRVETSAGATTLAPIHLVNETVPKMILSESGAIQSGQNVHFEVEDMLYGVTVPIESVTLTDPTGKVNVLEKITDWYLYGELFVLYNDVEVEDGRNNTPYKGVYTLTVYSNGFKTMTKQFNVTTGNEVPSKKGFIDATTRATTVVSGDGESSSATMQANLLYQGDLLINALIFSDLGIGNVYADEIATRWYEDTASYDAVFRKDGVTMYDYSYYYDAVQDAFLAGDYVSFDEYVATSGAKVYLNKPYAVKEILEDNLLGEVQYNGSYKGLTPPIMTLLDSDTNIVVENSSATFTSENEDFSDYLNEITAIYVNGDWQGLDDAYYSVDTSNNTLTINLENLDLDFGNVTIEIEAEGYKNNTLGVHYQKVVSQINATTDKESYERGENIVVDFGSVDNDFIKNLTTIKNTDNNKSIFAQGVGGSDYYYVISENKDKITIYDDGTFFNEDKIYTIALTANYYEPIELSFEITTPEVEIPDGGLLSPPTNEPSVTTDMYGDYRLTYSSNDLAWLNSINEVSVNGSAYSKGTVWNNEKYQLGTSNSLLLGKTKFTTGANIIIIKAEGYDDLTLSITGKTATVLNSLEIAYIETADEIVIQEQEEVVDEVEEIETIEDEEQAHTEEVNHTEEEATNDETVFEENIEIPDTTDVITTNDVAEE